MSRRIISRVRLHRGSGELRVELDGDRFHLVRADDDGRPTAVLVVDRDEFDELPELLDLATVALRSHEEARKRGQIQPGRYEIDDDGQMRGVDTSWPDWSREFTE